MAVRKQTESSTARYSRIFLSETDGQTHWQMFLEQQTWRLKQKAVAKIMIDKCGAECLCWKGSPNPPNLLDNYSSVTPPYHDFNCLHHLVLKSASLLRPVNFLERSAQTKGVVLGLDPLWLRSLLSSEIILHLTPSLLHVLPLRLLY